MEILWAVVNTSIGDMLFYGAKSILKLYIRVAMLHPVRVVNRGYERVFRFDI